MIRAVRVALDVGAATTVMVLGAAGPAGGAGAVVWPTPARDRDLPLFLSDLLKEGRTRMPGRIVGTAVVVSDAWLDGTTEGARAHERLRGVVLDGLGWPDVSWLGQSACQAAHCVGSGLADDGTLLVCALGEGTVGAALCEVSGAHVRVVRVRAARCADFEANVAEAVAATSPAAAFAERFAEVRRVQGRRAGVVLARAWTHPRYREAPVYRMSEGTVTAGTLIDAFAGAAGALRAAVDGALAGTVPDRVAAAGRIGDFPLVEAVVGTATGRAVRSLGAEAAVRGALLVGSGAVRVTPPERPAVRLPLHRVRNGLLDTERVRLDPAADFAPVLVEIPAEGIAPFDVELDGRGVGVRLPRLRPGTYRVGLRPAHTGPGVLVLSPTAGGEPFLYPLATEALP